MPELPEVEVVRAGVAALVRGRRVQGVQVLHPRSVRRHAPGPKDFEKTLVGREFVEPRRRGKYLWLPFADGDALSAHLGMSGQFRVDAATAAAPRHTRVEIALDGTPQVLRFADQRLFGGLWLSPAGADGPGEIAHIALDPFDPGFDAESVAARMARSTRAVKRLLLEQTLVSGIGNIYADESLWRARVHYLTPASALGQSGLLELLAAAKAVMAEALAVGGTSFDALYVDVAGESGYFERSLAVYGREGEPCPRCGTAIVREPFMGRSSYLCPDCQRLRAA
jgi:formamidopyrimidine-DNA glycosylase